MRFSIFQESRKGGRDANEDRTSYAYTRDALLMVVADGMGGHLHGEVASQIAAQLLTEAFQREARPTLADPLGFLQKKHHRRALRARRLRQGAQPGRVAADHLRGLRRAGLDRVLGACGRLAPLWFCSSGGQVFDQRLRGTTPNIAPPSSQNSQSGMTSTR